MYVYVGVCLYEWTFLVLVMHERSKFIVLVCLCGRVPLVQWFVAARVSALSLNEHHSHEGEHSHEVNLQHLLL